MNQTHGSSRPLVAASLGMLWLLSGCGGGGNGGVETGVPERTVQVTGQAIDPAGTPVPGVDIVYQYGNGSSSTATNNQGNYDLRLPVSQVDGIANPAICVIKDGFETQLVTFPALQGGQAYSASVTMAPLTPNVSIPRGGQCLWHLGDDNFIGSRNAQLQKASDGLVKAFAIEDWAARVATGQYTKVRIVLQAKGWQTDTCPNSVSLVGAGTGQEASLPGGVSLDAGWAIYSFEFDIAAIGPTSASVVMTTGACLSNDFDDFEFMQMRAEFF